MWRMLSLLGWLLIPGCATFVRSPQEWSGFLGTSLSVTCKYTSGYEYYKKYWCRGATWRLCEIVVRTTGSETEVKDGRTSIQDSHSHSEFTVRLDNLTKQDAGAYWCAIQRKGIDFKSYVLISVLPAPISQRKNGSTNKELDHSINSTFTETRNVSYMYVPLLISISLKISAFLCMVFAVIWMRRRSRQHPGEEAPP